MFQDDGFDLLAKSVKRGHLR